MTSHRGERDNEIKLLSSTDSSDSALVPVGEFNTLIEL